MAARPGTRSNAGKPSSGYSLAWPAGSQHSARRSRKDGGYPARQHGCRCLQEARGEVVGPPEKRPCTPLPLGEHCPRQVRQEPLSAAPDPSLGMLGALSPSTRAGLCWALPPSPASWPWVLSREPQEQGRKGSPSGPHPSLCRGGSGRVGLNSQPEEGSLRRQREKHCKYKFRHKSEYLLRRRKNGNRSSYLKG